MKKTRNIDLPTKSLSHLFETKIVDVKAKIWLHFFYNMNGVLRERIAKHISSLINAQVPTLTSSIDTAFCGYYRKKVIESNNELNKAQQQHKKS